MMASVQFNVPRVRHTHAGAEAILREILAGAACSAIARQHGLNRATVVRRAKALALQLARTVGVDGLRHEEAGFVRRLRRHRDALLAALQKYEPVVAASRRDARCLRREEIEQGAVRVKGRSRRRWHDLALYWLLCSTGLRPLEIARLQVRDYLACDGTVRRESCVRADVALSGTARPLQFASPELDDALGAYLRERVQRRHGLGTTGCFRGLDPGSALFLADDGRPYVVRSARLSAASRQFLCRTLLEVFRRIFRRADVPGLSTQSARLTVMDTLQRQGVQTREIGRMLGIQDARRVRDRLRMDDRAASPAAEQRA